MSTYPQKSGLDWPEDKQFAFTIVDDTDRSTVANVSAVYEFLHDLGFATTKTVWPMEPVTQPRTGGQSLEDREYRDWILELQAKGFEIAMHGIADGSSNRDRVIAGLSRFADVLGGTPRIHVNHVGQRECLYWGSERFDGMVRFLYALKQRLNRSNFGEGSSGHDESSSFFWGDLCLEKITYVRNLVFEEINTLKMDSLMPYHDPRRPYVPYWFSSSDGSGVDRFCHLISEANQDRLAAEGGACIVYTHLGSTFWEEGKLNQRFKSLMRRLSSLSGWFVPASTLLDYVGERRGWQTVGDRKQLRRMQRTWLVQKTLRRP